MNSMSHVWKRKIYNCWKPFQNTKQKSTKKKKQDLAKETVRFLCHTDYARLRGFNVKILMSHVWNATYMLLSIIMLLVSSESQISLN